MKKDHCKYLSKTKTCNGREGFCETWANWDYTDRKKKEAYWFCKQPKEYRKLYAEV